MTLKPLGNLEKGLLFVLSAPAGTGKTTLVQRLVASDEKIIESISYTTRAARPGEQEGDHYYFIDEPLFRRKVEQGEFLEHACLYGCHYGTSRSWVEEQRACGRHVILVIDTQGALQLRQDKVEGCFIFLLPPSLEELKERLHLRKTESLEVIERRLDWSKHEFLAVGHYDYLIINDDIDVAYEVLRSIIIAEEHRAAWMLSNPRCPSYLKTLSSML